MNLSLKKWTSEILATFELGTQFEVSLVNGSEQTKQALIEKSKLVTGVANISEQSACVLAAKDIQSLIKSTEEARKEVKAPVIELGKKIDGLAQTFSLTLSQELTRLNGLLTGFAVAEQKRIQREEEAKRKEEERLRMEAQKADAAFFEADTNEAELKALEQVEKAQTAIAQVPKTIVAPLARVDGMAVSQPWEFEVTDIKALYASRPDLCELSVSRSTVKTAIKSGMKTCPGLRIWQETKVGIR